MKKFLVVFLFCLLIAAIAAPSIALGQPCGQDEKDCRGQCVPKDNLCLNLSYPQFGPIDLSINQNITAIIGYVYYFIVGIAGLAAFGMLIWGGVQWLASGAAPSQAGEAKEKIRNAIVGLLLVLASFLIVQVINPELTILQGKVFPPIDCNLLGKSCNPLTFSATGASYVCTDWATIGASGNLDKALLCRGDVPAALNPGRPPEACTAIEAAEAPVAPCQRKCIDDGGGEYAYFGGTAYCCNVQSPGVTCNLGGNTINLAESTETIAPGIPLGIPYHLTYSMMRFVPGVYGCDDNNCFGGPDKAWRRFDADTPDVCGTPSVLAFPPGDRLCGQIGSLWIHGDIVAVLYGGGNYTGNRICLDGRSFASPPGKLFTTLDSYGWTNDANSIKVLHNGNSKIDTICPSFGSTLPP